MKSVMTMVVFLVLGVVALPVRAAENAGARPEEVAQHAIDAVRKRSYEAFLVDADDKVRTALTPQMFEGVSNMLKPRLDAGYTRKFLTKLRQKGMNTYLWKLEFSDGKDDNLLRITLDDHDKVAGIFFQ